MMHACIAAVTTDSQTFLAMVTNNECDLSDLIFLLAN